MSLYEGAEDAKRVLSADNMDQMALLFGALDENVETVQQRTGARIRAMGTEKILDHERKLIGLLADGSRRTLPRRCWKS